MDRIDDRYINAAIDLLIATVGVKEAFDPTEATRLIRQRNYTKAIEEIARYLGLPIKIHLKILSKDYDPRAAQRFHTTDLVRTERSGGPGGVVAEVSIPVRLPEYESQSLEGFPIVVGLGEECTASPETLITVMAHELSHVALYSMRHRQAENEIYTDITSFMLGFYEVARWGRTHREYSFLGGGRTVTTTTFGYLTDEQFELVYKRISKEASLLRERRVKLCLRWESADRVSNSAISKISDLRVCLTLLSEGVRRRKLPRNDQETLYSLYQPGYLDELDKLSVAVVRGLQKMSERLGELRRLKGSVYYKTAALLKELDEHYERATALARRVDTALFVAKRYTPIGHRIRRVIDGALGGHGHKAQRRAGRVSRKQA